ncbi:MAG: alpha/beta hydrolase [Acidimicrobiales bacterium]
MTEVASPPPVHPSSDHTSRSPGRFPSRTRLHLPLLTAVVVGAVASSAIRFGSLSNHLPLGVVYAHGFSGRSLIQGDWTRVYTSLLLTRDVFMTVSIIASLIVFLGLYELMAGTRRALIVALVSAVAGPIVFTAGAKAGSWLGITVASHAVSTFDYGASTITAGAGGALVGLIRRRALGAAAVIFVLGGLLVHHQLADWEHLICMPIGWVLGARMGRSSSRTPGPAGARLGPIAGKIRRAMDRWRPIAAWRPGSAALVGAAMAIGTLTSGLAIATPASAGASGPSSPGSVQRAPSGPFPVAASGAGPVSVIDTSFPAPSIGRRQRVIVLLPANYASSRVRLPTIEFLHGRPGAPDNFFAATHLLELAGSGALPSFIGVIPDGHGPVVSDGDFANTTKQQLGTAMSKDLQTWLSRHYRTNGYWGITGLSAGGYGAAYLASLGGYQATCPMSGYFKADPTIFAGQPASVIRADSPLYHVSRHGPPTMLVVGNTDTGGLADAKRYAQAMAAVGQVHRLVVLPGGHDWPLWDAGLTKCLPFLLGAK